MSHSTVFCVCDRYRAYSCPSLANNSKPGGKVADFPNAFLLENRPASSTIGPCPKPVPMHSGPCPGNCYSFRNYAKKILEKLTSWAIEGRKTCSTRACSDIANSPVGLPYPRKVSRIVSHPAEFLLDTPIPLEAESTRHSETSRIRFNSRDFSHFTFSTRQLFRTPFTRHCAMKTPLKTAPPITLPFARDIWHSRARVSQREHAKNSQASEIHACVSAQFPDGGRRSIA
jgi:hypothetical protein